MDPTTTPITPRQIKVPLPLMDKVLARAAKDPQFKNTPGEHAIAATLLRDYVTRYANRDLTTPQLHVTFPAGRVPVPQAQSSHYDQQRRIETRVITFRIADELWEAALARASADGSALSPMITRYLLGYAHHIID